MYTYICIMYIHTYILSIIYIYIHNYIYIGILWYNCNILQLGDDMSIHLHWSWAIDGMINWWFSAATVTLGTSHVEGETWHINTYQTKKSHEELAITCNNYLTSSANFGFQMTRASVARYRKVSLAPGLEKPTNHKATGIHQKKPVIFGGLYPLNHPSKCPYKASYIYIIII